MTETAGALLGDVTTLYKNGYHPVPLYWGKKRPVSDGWQTDLVPLERLEVEYRTDSNKKRNVGLLLGHKEQDNSCLIAIDIDVDDPWVYEVTERAMGALPPCKVGAKGRTYFIRMRYPVSIRRIRQVIKGKKTAKPVIEVLGERSQTVVPPSLHDKGMTYKWIEGYPSLLETPYKKLPLVSEAFLDEIAGAMRKGKEDPIVMLNDMTWAGVGEGGDTHDTCVAAVASMVSRQWKDNDIIVRVIRAKREACERAKDKYEWPGAKNTIEGWISSSREKKFDETSKAIPRELIERYIYVKDLDRTYDVQNGRMYSKSQVTNFHADEVPRAWDRLLSQDDLRRVDGITYYPGQPLFCREKSFVGEWTSDCVNTYHPTNLEAIDEPPQHFIDHLFQLCDSDQQVFNHIVSFFAYMVQYPGNKIHHALLIQGKQGTGKSFLYHAVAAVLGKMNVRQISYEDIDSAFNEWLFGSQLIFVEEIAAGGRREFMNRLKPYITEERVRINEKMMPRFDIWNRVNLVYFTNHKHAIHIDEDDRRHYVHFSNMEVRTPSYYDALFSWLKSPTGPGQLKHYFQTWDLGDFDPHAPPTTTAAKRIVRALSRGDQENWLQQALEAEAWPFKQDFVNIRHLIAAAQPRQRLSANVLAQWLDDVGAKKYPSRPVLPDGTRVILHILRNHDKWMAMDSDALVAAYRRPMPPEPGEPEGYYEGPTSKERPF